MMKKRLLIILLFLLFSATSAYSAATYQWLRINQNGGTKSCDNIQCDVGGTGSGLLTGDICHVVDSNGYEWWYRYDSTDTSAEDIPWIIVPDDRAADCSGNGAWQLIYDPKNHEKSIAETVADNDTTITNSQWFQVKEWDNQGSTAEADWKLPSYSHEVTRTVTTEETVVMEICPPAGETMFLDGSTLDANDCVDTDTTVGSVIVIKRQRNASGTWFYSIVNVLGTATDTGATD